MVVREYVCKSCGSFELKQPITDAPLEVCPTCKKSIRQIYGSPQVLWQPAYDVETDEIVSGRPHRQKEEK